jgi:molybdopterin-guanine dinucleotide biosynthesis protein A
VDDSATRGVVLAGGRSRRFGDEPKALATLDGDPLVRRVARTLRTATGQPPAVAARDRRETLAPALDDPLFVADAPGFEGPLAGVVGAARATASPWLFVCACDMPLVSPAAVEWLAARADGTDAVVVVDDGTVQPVHALYRREAVVRVARDLPGDAGVRALVDALDDVRRVPVAAGDEAGLASSLTNVNTAAELRALRSRTDG